MMRKRYCYSILVIVLAVFLTHPAFAAKCVKPNGAGNCFDNIQDAIDAVNPGGTVKIYPGIYYDAFTANKASITIQGMGNKRSDVRIDRLGTGSNVISAGNVTIKNMTIQNGDNGITIFAGGINAKILNVNIFNSEHHGISIDSTQDTLIKNCKILKSGGNGIDNSGGDRLTVQNTTISDCGENGIYSGGDQLTIDDCTIKDAALDLIRVAGSQVTIQDNQLYKAGRHGIYADSDFVKVTGNVVRGAGENGILLGGMAPVVKNNTVMYAQDDGFYLNTTGDDLKVVNNLSSYNDRIGFHIESNFFVLIKKNKALNNLAGFYILGYGDKIIIENQSKYNTEIGFSVIQGTLENNIASENGIFGFELNNDNTAIQNKAFNNMNAGFLCNGGTNFLRKNRAIGNLFYGIYVTGDNNNIINNTMLDSGLSDKCDEGIGNAWTGNTYDTECP